MKRIIKYLLLMILSLFFCFPSYATEWTRFYDIRENGSEYVYYVQIPSNAEFGYYYAEDAVNPVPYMYCTVPFEYCIGDYTPSSSRYSSDKKYASGGQVFYVGGSNYKTMIGSYGNAIGIPASDTVGVYDYLLDNGFIGGTSSQDYAYDSSIPAPQNLKLDFIETKVGIIGLSKRTDLQLSWSNVLVDEYGVQISAAMTVEVLSSEGSEIHTKKKLSYKLVGLSQVDSGGSDAGYPAKTGKYTVTEDELLTIAQKELGDSCKVEKVSVDAFRVQFYHIDSGVVSVGRLVCLV